MAPTERFRNLELIAVPLVGCALFYLFSRAAGGPLTWDELLYMEASWNSKALPWVLNRYAHIHLQSLFMHLVGDPLQGARVYWGFLISGTLVGVYLCARILADRTPVLIGLIAVALFLHLRLPFRYSGTTYADFTLMFFSVWTAVVFVMGAGKSGKGRTALFVALGLLLFLSLKSKEHGAVLLLFLLGLGREQGAFSLSRLGGDLLTVFLGIGAGLMAFVAIDSIVLGSPFFSFRPGNVESVLDYNVGAYEERSPDSFLETLASRTLVLPFFLYLIASFGGAKNKTSLVGRIVGSIPLAHILFLIGALAFVKYRVSDRQLIGALPLLCVGAARFFQPLLGRQEEGGEGRIPQAFWFLLAGLPAAASVALGLPERIGAPGGWSPFALDSAVVIPGGTLLLLALASWYRWAPSRALLFTIGLVFWMTLLPGVKTNVSSLVRDVAGEESRRRFLPLETFRAQIPIEGNPNFVVSGQLYDLQGMFGRNAESCSIMFDLFFATDTDPGQFAYSESLDPADLAQGFAGVFATKEDLESLPADAESGLRIGDREYTLFQDDSSGLIFLRGGAPNAN